MSSVIIGPRTLAQAADLLAAADVRLAPETLDRIDALVPPGSDVDARRHHGDQPRPGRADRAPARALKPLPRPADADGMLWEVLGTCCVIDSVLPPSPRGWR